MKKKLLAIIFISNFLLFNTFAIEPDVFVQSTVNRASQILSENLSKERKIELEDVLVVAPYNMQVNNLIRNLPFNSKVGTIDKFQGQEAKIVFISMTSSDPENIPRHKGFLFSRNRLDVGISWSECTTII